MEQAYMRGNPFKKFRNLRTQKNKVWHKRNSMETVICACPELNIFLYPGKILKWTLSFLFQMKMWFYMLYIPFNVTIPLHKCLYPVYYFGAIIKKTKRDSVIMFTKGLHNHFLSLIFLQKWNKNLYSNRIYKGTKEFLWHSSALFT